MNLYAEKLLGIFGKLNHNSIRTDQSSSVCN